MKKRFQFEAVALSSMALAAVPASAQLFGPGDPVLAVDLDIAVLSSYPANEGPANAVDQFDDTKYLNFGRGGSGLIVTPLDGPSTVQCLQITTANDAEGRDPTSYELYGTDDPITSADNSAGNEEDWVLISSGALNLPSDRFTPGDFHDFANATEYASYKLVFPSLKDAFENSMQIADFRLYTEFGGAGTQVILEFDPALAVGREGSESFYPAVEGPANAIDGTTAKYLNFGRANTGLIVRRADGLPTIVEEFTITTANDFEDRDPAAWELYATDDPVTSPDNSAGENESWILVDSGTLSLPSDRDTAGSPVAVSNSTAYGAYMMIFTDLKDTATADSMQIAEIEFAGSGGGCPPDWNGDGILNSQDFVAFLNDFVAGNADYNADGTTNSQDFVAFLNDFVAGC
jgi:hypothetical protein